MFCTNCGTRFNKGDLFCTECGLKINYKDLDRLGCDNNNVREDTPEVSSAFQNGKSQSHSQQKNTQDQKINNKQKITKMFRHKSQQTIETGNKIKRDSTTEKDNQVDGVVFCRNCVQKYDFKFASCPHCGFKRE